MGSLEYNQAKAFVTFNDAITQESVDQMADEKIKNHGKQSQTFKKLQPLVSTFANVADDEKLGYYFLMNDAIKLRDVWLVRMTALKLYNPDNQIDDAKFWGKVEQLGSASSPGNRPKLQVVG